MSGIQTHNISADRNYQLSYDHNHDNPFQIFLQKKERKKGKSDMIQNIMIKFMLCLF